MSARRIEIAVDYRTILLFLEVACKLEKAKSADVFPDCERHAARLLIMLGSIGEFNVITTVSQVERLFEALRSRGFSDKRMGSVWNTLKRAVQVIPDSSTTVRKSLEDGENLPLELCFLKASAEQVQANVVVSPLVTGLEKRPEVVVSPVEFFAEVKKRYGFDYAELAV